MRACVVCGTPSAGTRCAVHQHDEDARRSAKSRSHGLRTRVWRRTRALVLERDMHCCRIGREGCTFKATSVHRLPEYGPFHDDNLDAYVSACAHCHGVIDGARAH